MRIEVTLKNFRAFSDAHPARFIIEPGFTAFVGANNAGKTSLLRLFYEMRSVFQILATPGTGELNSLLQGNQMGVALGDVTDPDELFNNRTDRNIELTVAIPEATTDSGVPVPRAAKIILHRPTNNMSFSIEPDPPEDNTVELRDDGLGLVGGTPGFDFRPYAEAFELMATTTYIAAFRNAITVGGATLYDLRIGREFIAAWDGYKAGTNRAQTRAALSVEEDIARIFGFESLALNATANNDNLLAVIDGDVHLLSELGAGVTQFILVLAFAAVTTPQLILIDEPESSLHPSLQLSFLTALGAHAGTGVLFATHSIGLARAAAERIYVVRAIRRGESELTEIERTPRLSELLGELSFDGYRELGFDAVMLVEGATDVKVVKELLRQYGDGRKALLVPLGGAQLIRADVGDQLGELTRISENIWAVVDSERESADDDLPERIAAFAQECEQVGIRCHVLERKAIENYLPDRAVKAAFGEQFRALQPYERLSDLSPSWGKPDNWRVAREVRRDELAETDLDAFLEEFAATLD
jgi:ABC-type branched-subunit amino acid transport system ATPase component